MTYDRAFEDGTGPHAENLDYFAHSSLQDARENDSDHIETAADRDELRSTAPALDERTAVSMNQQTAPQQGGMRAPYNPFARTLASTEAAYKTQTEEDGIEEGDGGRPALDVDTFTNILLTGSAVPARPPPSKDASRTSNGSETQTAVSHSVESVYRPSSLELDRSDSSDDDEEQATKVDLAPTNMNEGKSEESAPPKRPRGPQTVSFADFDQSIPPGFHSRGPRASPSNSQLHGILRPTLSRSSSDVNKPLPRTPPVAINQTPSSTPDSVGKPVDPAPMTPTLAEFQKEPAEAPATPQAVVEPIVQDSPSVKKRPPPPPASRRQANAGDRPRSVILPPNATIATPERSSAASAVVPEDSPAKVVPPPPPSRKTLPANATAAAPQSSKPIVAEAAPQSTEIKTMPPPPPRRQPSRSGSHTPRSQTDSPAPNRTESQSTQAVQAAQHAPPPPPPRRGAGSKRNSGDFRRSSVHSFDSDRSLTTATTLQPVAEPADAEEKASANPSIVAAVAVANKLPESNILADMTAFQAEIDALMAKADKSAPGG